MIRGMLYSFAVDLRLHASLSSRRLHAGLNEVPSNVLMRTGGAAERLCAHRRRTSQCGAG